jgi:hypothetical protein
MTQRVTSAADGEGFAERGRDESDYCVNDRHSN